MCSICDDFKTKKINSKEAFAQIADALRSASSKKTNHLMELSSTILDTDVPMPERDAAAEKNWQDGQEE